MGGMREAQKQATRAALRAHALRLFAQRGFRGTTIREIAAAARVSPRTFFLHFTSKEEVLLGKVDERLAQLRTALRNSPAEGEPLDRIAHVFVTMAADLERSDDLPLQLQLLETVPSILGEHYERFRAFEETVARTVHGWLDEALPPAQRQGGAAGFAADDEVRHRERLARLITAVSLATVRAGVQAWYDEYVRPAGEEPVAGRARRVAPGALPRMVDAGFGAVRHGLTTSTGEADGYGSGSRSPDGGAEPVTVAPPALPG